MVARLRPPRPGGAQEEASEVTSFSNEQTTAGSVTAPLFVFMYCGRLQAASIEDTFDDR